MSTWCPQVFKRHISRYLSLGLAVITPSSDGDYNLVLSTNLLERNIIRPNRVIREIQIVMNYYSDNILNIFHPSFDCYYKRAIKTVIQLFRYSIVQWMGMEILRKSIRTIERT